MTTDTTTDAPAPPGHNRPPLTGIRERLADDYAALAERAEELAGKAETAPAEVADDDDLGAVADLTKDVAGLIKRLDAAHADEKEPHLKAGREIDGWFKALMEPLAKVKRGLEYRAGRYLRAKEERERQARLEAERQARAEAEAKLREAQALEEENRRRQSDEALRAAREAERDAERAHKQAAAPAAELARTRSTESGALSTLKEVWDFEVADYDAVPLEVLRPYLHREAIDKAIRGLIRAGRRELAGVKIFKRDAAMFR